MRTNALSVLLGGALVLGGYFVGAAQPFRSSEAGVTADAGNNLIFTSGDISGITYVWERQGEKITRVTRYTAESGAAQNRLVRVEYLPEAAEKPK